MTSDLLKLSTLMREACTRTLLRERGAEALGAAVNAAFMLMVAAMAMGRLRCTIEYVVEAWGAAEVSSRVNPTRRLLSCPSEPLP